MCNHCSSDPRDLLAEGTRALRGIVDLVSDLRAAGGDFEATTPSELGELLDMVSARIERANEGLGDYVPRNWTPPKG